MKSLIARGRALPFFVVLALTCISLYQSPAFAGMECPRAVGPEVSDIISEGRIRGTLKLRARQQATYVETTPDGEREYVSGEPFRMRIMTWNVKNLFTNKDDALANIGATHVSNKKNNGKNKKRKKSKGDSQEKPDHEMDSVRATLKEYMPDIIAVQEVENKIAGEELINEDPALRGKYKFFLIEGNDTRGIDVGIYVKTDLPFDYEYQTHKELTWVDPRDPEQKVIPLFSRDFAVLKIFKKDSTGEKKNRKPIQMIGVVHSKSKRTDDRRPWDHESSARRTAQAEGIRKIMDQYDQQYGEEIPFVIAGDFNTEVQTSAEVSALRDVTKSAFDLAEQDMIPKDKRGTHAYFPKGGQPERDQIDDIRVRGLRVERVEIGKYRDRDGNETEWPHNYKDREEKGSDHKPIIADTILQER